MGNLTAGRTEAALLQVGSTVTVNAQAGSARVFPINANGVPGPQVTVSATQTTFGPFDDIAMYRVFCDAGIVTVSQVDPDKRNMRPYVASATEGRSKGFTIPAGSVLRLAASATAFGTVRERGTFSPVTAYTGAEMVVGPFATVRYYIVTSTLGTISGETEWTAGDLVVPTITSSNPSASYLEGVAIGGTLIANESVTWSKSGADATRVTLNTLTGVWSLEATDYETKTSYSWTFSATDAANNVGSQVVSVTITNVDEVAPTLSSPVDNATGATSAVISVTTNEANGTLYWFVGTSATPPTSSALKAGSGAAAHGSQSVSSAGVQNITVSDLTASTGYHAYMLHRDTAGNESAIAAGNGFTTESASAEMAYTLTDTVSYKGETLTLNKPAKVGYALNGRPFIVSDTVSLSWTSSSTPSVLVGSYWANGAMFDPRFIGTDLQGADGIIGALSGSQGAAAMPYSHPVNTDPGANGAFALTGKCGRIVKTIRKAGMTAPDATWSVFDKCLFIDVVPSVPPAGAVCPIYDGMGGVQWVTSAMMRKSVLRGCGYVAGQQTLAACKAGGYIPDIDIPYMFDNGEERRIWHSIGTWPGYGSDEAETRYGPLLSAMHAEGAAGALDADWWALMSVACSITENSRRGHIMRGGAGQNNGQKPLTVTLAMSTRDATIAANALAYEGNETHQQFWLTADWMGAGTPGVYPGSASSHGGYFKSPFEPEQIGTPQWFHGGQALPPSPLSDLSGIDGDIMARYQVVSSPAAMLGFTNMGLLQDGPGGVDGLTFLLNGGATNSTNPYAAPHAYYEWYRTADSGMTSSAEHIAFVLPLYDLMRGLSSVPRMPSAPQAFCPQYNQTNYINATTGGFSLDFTNAGNKTETITRLDLRYTMDGGRTFLNDLNVTRPTYSRSDFPRQYPIGIQNKRYSTSGESVWTRNTPKIAAAFLTITTVAGSKTATVASVASGDILTVGWTLMAQGVLHGDTTIASFGTYDNTTKVGTILLTKPAVKTQASAVQAYAGIGRFLITATGSASGAAVNAQAPQIVKRRYPTLAVERYDPADATTAVGATLYGGVGWWTGDLTAGFTFSWKVEGVEVSTADQYTVQSGDASITLDVTNAGVTATSSNTINNIALAFTSAASGNVAESATLSHTLTATRPATWAIRTSGQDAASVDYAQFEISGSTLRWVSNGTKDYEAPADTGANNTYVVVVRATNAYTGQTVDQTITYTVTDVVEGSESYYDFASGAAGQELTAFLPAWTRDSTEARVASNGAGALRRLGTTAATHFYREGVNTSGTQRAGMTFLTSGTQQLQLAVFGLWSGEAFSGYSVYASAATTLLVRKWVAGVGSTLATITVAAATGVAFELEAHDTGTATELKVFAAGVQQGTTAVDSAGTRRASGYNGIYNEGSTTLSSPMADDFRGNIQF